MVARASRSKLTMLPRQASRMVQSYAMFMEEKIEMHHDVRFPYERNTEDAARHVADVCPSHQHTCTILVQNTASHASRA